MYTAINTEGRAEPWNKSKLLGQEPPLKLKEIWAIGIRSQLAHRARELALFNLGHRQQSCAGAIWSGSAYTMLSKAVGSLPARSSCGRAGPVRDHRENARRGRRLDRNDLQISRKRTINPRPLTYVNKPNFARVYFYK